MKEAETNNNETIRQTHPVYYFIIIRVVTRFEPTGSSSGLHCEPINCKAAYILGIRNIASYLTGS